MNPLKILAEGGVQGNLGRRSRTEGLHSFYQILRGVAQRRLKTLLPRLIGGKVSPEEWTGFCCVPFYLLLKYLIK